MKPNRLIDVGVVEFASKPNPVGLLRACCKLKLTLLLLAICLVMILVMPAYAADGALDPAFDPGAGVSNIPILWAPAHYADGRMLIGGDVTTVNGVARTSIARINANGSLDDTFNVTVDGTIYNIILLNSSQADSQILIGGEFTLDSSTGPYYGLARLNANGTVDDTFAHAFTIPRGVNNMAIQRVSTGSYTILVGGYCMGIGDSNNTYYLLRLTMNGALMTGNPMDLKRADPGAYVRFILVDNATQNVRLCATVPRLPDRSHVDYLTLIDINNVVTPLIGDEVVNGPILYYAADASSRAVIAGSFTNVNGTPMHGVARFQAGGWTLDDSFQIGSGASSFVQRLIIDGTKIVLAGPFTSFNGTPCGYMVRLYDNGSVDTGFNQGGTGADDRIWTMYKRTGDNTWMILGPFRHFNGSSRQGIANLTIDGGLNGQYSTVTTGNNKPASVRSIVVQDDGKIIIGGEFTGYGGKCHRGIARLNPDGTVDASFTAGVGGSVSSLALQADGKLLVSGFFPYAGGYFARGGLARFNPDGTIDRTFWPIVTNSYGWGFDNGQIVPLANGQILITGLFTSVNYTPVTHEIARLNANGSLDSTFNAQISFPGSNQVNISQVAPTGDNYVVTGTAWYPGPYFNRFLTRLTSTGAIDTSFTATGTVPHINILTGATDMDAWTLINILRDGKILVSGDFTQVEDGSLTPPQRQWIARFSSNGLLDNTFTSPYSDWIPPEYLATALQPNNRILIGGGQMARLYPDGSWDEAFEQGRGFVSGGTVRCIVPVPGGKSLIGGSFTAYGGVSRPGIARILTPSGTITPTLFLLLDQQYQQ